jgi:hypothetical protein
MACAPWYHLAFDVDPSSGVDAWARDVVEDPAQWGRLVAVERSSESVVWYNYSKKTPIFMHMSTAVSANYELYLRTIQDFEMVECIGLKVLYKGGGGGGVPSFPSPPSTPPAFRR